MLNRKHIRAPKTFDPGPGLPRERLAYLSDAEAEMLRVLTDGTVNRGPRGIPSFAVTSGTTSGSTMGSSERTSSNPSGGGPGGPFGANSGPSKSTTSSPMSGGGNKGIGGSAPAASGSATGGKVSSGASTPSASPKSPSTASSSPAKAPSGGSPGLNQSQIDAYKGYGASRAASAAPASPMGGQSASRDLGIAGVPGGMSRTGTAQAPRSPSPGSGSSPVAAGVKSPIGGLSQPQRDAYTQFGQKMAAAPRAPEVPRAPGDAAQLARMAQAESGLIRDPVTGKMSQLGATAVMDTIRNRMSNQNLDVENVINQKAQFSPWGDGSYAATPADPAYTALAEQVLRGVTPDYTMGADTYHNPTTVNGGYSKASAATVDRINNNFKETLNVADAVKPGVYGHSFGIAADGTDAARKRASEMGSPTKRGQTNYGTGHIPTAANLPQGALSQDPNWGGMGSAPPAAPDHVPGRFGGLRPDAASNVSRVSYDDISQYPASSPEAGRFATSYQPDRWERDVGFLAGRTISPNEEEAALPGYANPYAAIDPRLIEGAAGMIRKAEAATGTTATINDAYRTPWHQAIGAPAKPGQKAKPGNSWHQAGTAIDIGAGPVQDYLNANRASLPKEFGIRKPESMMNPANPDYPHFQLNDITKPFENSALKNGLTPPGGYQTASALSPAAGQFAAPETPYSVSEGGWYNALKSAPGAISGLLSGLNTQPIKDVMSNPVVGKVLKDMGPSGNPLARAATSTLFGAVAGPKIRDAASSAFQSMKDIGNPDNPRARAAAAERAAAAGVDAVDYTGRPYDAVSAPARTGGSSETEKADKRGSGGSKGRGRGGDRENGRQKDVVAKPKRGRRAVATMPVEDLATPPTPPRDPWESYMNPMTREQALRKLLGEEWYA